MMENHDLAGKIGLIGDVHAEEAILSAVLAYFKEENISHILCAGDICDGEGDVDKSVELLRQYGVHSVAGNHDRWTVHQTWKLGGRTLNASFSTPLDSITEETVAYLKELPKALEFTTPQGNLLLCHGVGTNDMRLIVTEGRGHSFDNNPELEAIIRKRQHRFMVNGHSHSPIVMDIHGLLVVNPGTLARNEKPGFAILDFDKKSVAFYQLNTELAISLHQTVSL